MDGCLFRLASMLGVTVDDLRNHMTSLELIEWCRFLRGTHESA